jgi:hypothetical protein
MYPWVDIEELDHDDAFEQLVAAGGDARLGHHGRSRPLTSVTSPAGGAFTFTGTPKSK